MPGKTPALVMSGRLRYVDGQCWLDAGEDGQVPMPLIGRIAHVDLRPQGGSVLELDGQRVTVTVAFLDEGQ